MREKHDPNDFVKHLLLEHTDATEDELKAIDKDVRAEVAAACDRAKADLGYRPLLSSTEGMRRVAQKYEQAEARRGRTPRPLSYFVLGLLLAVALWWALRAAP